MKKTLNVTSFFFYLVPNNKNVLPVFLIYKKKSFKISNMILLVVHKIYKKASSFSLSASSFSLSASSFSLSASHYDWSSMFGCVLYLFADVEFRQVFFGDLLPAAERRQVSRGAEPQEAQGDPNQHRLLETYWEVWVFSVQIWSILRCTHKDTHTSITQG